VIPDQLSNSGWSSDKWDQLEARARSTFEHHAHLRKAIPRGPDMLDAYVVEQPKRSEDDAGLSVAIESASVPTTIRVRFTLMSNQLGDDGLAERLVDRAARVLAVAEDWALYHGKAATTPHVEIQHASQGLRDLDSNPSLAASAAEAVADGMLALQQNGAPYVAPYALASEPRFWRAIALPSDERPRGLVGQVEALLGHGSRLMTIPEMAGANETSNEPKRSGRAVLFATDPFALDLVVVEPPAIALDCYSNGGLRLYLEEKFLLRVIDRAAMRTLAF
jgi:uncharacterized linocin/CFP29 family protein